MAFGIGLTPAQIARKDREYRSSQGSPFANSARYRNPHPPLSLTNKGRGHSKSNVKMYKLQWRAGTPAPLTCDGPLKSAESLKLLSSYSLVREMDTDT